MSKIIEHSANGRNYLIMEVPKEGVGFEVYDTPEKSYIDCWVKCHFSLDVWKCNLPTGPYRIMFIAEQATEEQAEQVVEKHPWDKSRYTHYAWIEWTTKNPDEALQSLIRHKFTDTTKHHLILEKL